MQFSYEIKIPKDRIAVLVGVKGKVKNKIESVLHIKIMVDSKEGDVVFYGEDSLALMTAQNIVKAIGRGFNPEVALELLDESNYFELIDISDYGRGSSLSLVRLRSRIIGTGGKARKAIEQLTNTNVVIYGKTIGIIGDHESVGLARKAFESLLTWSRHSTVYSWLQRHRKKIRHRMYWNEERKNKINKSYRENLVDKSFTNF